MVFTAWLYRVAHGAGDRLPARSREEAGDRGRQAPAEAEEQGAVHARRQRPRHVQPDPAV